MYSYCTDLDFHIFRLIPVPLPDDSIIFILKQIFAFLQMY